MKSILFATGNQRKVDEAKAGCSPYNIEVNSQSFDIDEIQSADPAKVTEHKVRAAYQHANRPVVVTDTFWNIPALNGFPGAYMKDVAQWFSEEDFLNLINDKDDKRISFTENIAYYDGNDFRIFSKEYWGMMVPPRGTGNSIENVAEFDSKTLGERRTEGGFSHKPEDYIWAEFARWYSAATEPVSVSR